MARWRSGNAGVCKTSMRGSDSLPRLMYYVYILYSPRFNFTYKGMTSDIDRRINEHNAGKVRLTKLKHPLELIHVELCVLRIEAREIEKYLKSGYGREIIQELITLRGK